MLDFIFTGVRAIKINQMPSSLTLKCGQPFKYHKARSVEWPFEAMLQNT
jgi:hypothetical protein